MLCGAGCDYQVRGAQSANQKATLTVLTNQKAVLTVLTNESIAGGGGGVSQQGGHHRHQGPGGGVRGPAHQDMQVTRDPSWCPYKQDQSRRHFVPIELFFGTPPKYSEYHDHDPDIHWDHTEKSFVPVDN